LKKENENHYQKRILLITIKTIMTDFILKIWIWISFIRNKETLPTESKITNPKFEYETMSGAFIWEDEGLWELKNHHLQMLLNML
jgi:hypothetical protein